MARNSSVNKYFNYGGIEVSSLYNFKDKKKATDNYIFTFLTKMIAMFEYEGLPDSIPQEEMEEQVMMNGFSIVGVGGERVYRSYTGGFGGSRDAYYKPKTVIVSNPYDDTYKEFEIGKDCVLIRNDPFCIGVLPMLSKYATQLVETDLSLNITTVFKRMTALFSTTDDKTAESAEKFLNKIINGEYSVIYDDSLINTLQAQELSGSGAGNLLSQLIETRQYWLGSLYNEIGLKSVTNMKKENVSELESSQNNDILIPYVYMMLKCRERACKEMNDMFGWGVSVKLSNVWRARAEEIKTEIEKEGELDETNREVPELGDE